MQNKFLGLRVVWDYDNPNKPTLRLVKEVEGDSTPVFRQSLIDFGHVAVEADMSGAKFYASIKHPITEDKYVFRDSADMAASDLEQNARMFLEALPSTAHVPVFDIEQTKRSGSPSDTIVAKAVRRILDSEDYRTPRMNATGQEYGAPNSSARRTTCDDER